MEENIFEEDFTTADEEEVKMKQKRTFKEWCEDNAEWLLPVAAGGTVLGLMLRSGKKRKAKADLEAEKELIGAIAYQAGQRDAYKDVATRKRRGNKHHHHNNNMQ